MRWAPSTIVLVGILLLSQVPVPAADTTADEKILRDAKLGTDTPAVLEYLRKRTSTRADADKIKSLIKQLGDESFDVREEATQELIRIGGPARPSLEVAAKDGDVERARRATECLSRITGGGGISADAAAARLLAVRKPAGAAEVLLSFVPAASNSVVADEAANALAALAVRDGKPEPVLVTGLSAKEPLKRAAAAVALCRAGVADSKPAIRALLKDPAVPVRFQVGRALADAHEKEAVPVLIDLLTELPREQAWEVEDLLIRLAGKDRPTVPIGTDAGARKRCRDAWADWWDKNGAKVKLETPKLLGHTLCILLADGAETGTVSDRDAQGKTVWEVKDIEFPLDAQLLPNDHILCAEHHAKSVRERDLKGKVLWEKAVTDGPLVAQRLDNGNTFIVTEQQILEVDKDGKEVLLYSRPDGKRFSKAQKQPNGDIVAVLHNLVNGQRVDQEFIRLGPDRKDILKYPLDPSTGGVRTSGGRIEVLPNGNVLIPMMNDNKVAEYDTEGHLVWEAKVEQPVNAVRLANGNTLVTTYNQHRAIEIDRAGREASEIKADVRVTRAWRR